MGQFFERAIFIGITLIANVLVWIILYRRKFKVSISNIEDKKKELLSLVEDADEMIQELNNLSGYICTRIDQKNTALNQTIDELKTHLDKLEKIQQENLLSIETPLTESINDVVYDSVKASEDDVNQIVQTNIDFHAFNSIEESEVLDEDIDKVCKNWKHMNNTTVTSQKYKKIVNLSEQGLSNIEIAKNLNMGRGEVQLILDTHK